MNKPIAFAICAKNKTGVLPTIIVECILCEEDCHFSGFGNESAEKFFNGEHIKLDDKFRVKHICKECSHTIFHKEIEVIFEMAKMRDKEGFMQQVNELLKNHDKNNE